MRKILDIEPLNLICKNFAIDKTSDYLPRVVKDYFFVTSIMDRPSNPRMLLYN